MNINKKYIVEIEINDLVIDNEFWSFTTSVSINGKKEIDNYSMYGKHNCKDDEKKLEYFKNHFENSGALNQVFCGLAIK